MALQTVSDQPHHEMRLVFSLQILLDLGPDQSATRPIPIPTNQSTCMLSKNMRGGKNEIAGLFKVNLWIKNPNLTEATGKEFYYTEFIGDIGVEQ